MAQMHRERGRDVAFDLPALASGCSGCNAAEDKISLVLRLLRKAAVEHRESRGRQFYSIRAVAKHFALPTTTVTRLYSQLKVEGVLGSIWGSKTIIEPAQLDNDIRVKAMVALPLPVRALSVLSTYRHFVRAMQRALWKERFASRIVFYDEALFDGCTVLDALLESRTDIVVWLMPPPRMSIWLSRLKDRGVKSVIIADEVPINGGPGYYLSWEDPLLEGLSAWRRSHIRRAVVIKNPQPISSSRLRLLHSCLGSAGIAFESCEIAELETNRRSIGEGTGLIFTSAQSIVQFAYTGLGRLADLLQQTRVLFVHGGVELPFATHLNPCFDTVDFDWRIIARRIVSDLLIDFWRGGMQEQTIFKGTWRPGNRLINLQ